MLTDHGREFRVQSDRYAFELLLRLEQIEQYMTLVRRPQRNGFVGRFHSRLLEEHVDIQGREKFFETLEEMQRDLDCCPVRSNAGQSFQELNVKRRMPLQDFW